MFEFGTRFLRQASLAVTVFGSVAMVMEWAIPGSVGPYIDVIPYLVVGLSGLAIDISMTAVVQGRSWVRWVVSVLLCCVVIATALVQFNGGQRMSLIVAAFLGISVWAIVMASGAPEA